MGHSWCPREIPLELYFMWDGSGLGTQTRGLPALWHALCLSARPGPALAPGGQAFLSQPRAPPHRAWALRGSARQGHREALWVFWPLSVLLLSLCLMLHSVPRARQRRKCFLSVVPLLSAGMLWNPPSEQSTTSLSPPPLLLPSRPESISETSWRLHWRVWFFTLFNKSYWELGGFPGGTSGKEPACQCKRRQVRSLGWEDPLEKGAATRSRILAWRIPGTEELTFHQWFEHQKQLTFTGCLLESRSCANCYTCSI